MLGQLIVNFDHATQDGVVEGSLALSDLDGAEVKLGDRVGVMDGGAGPYEAEVIKVDGDRVRVRAPALSTPRSRPGLADAENIERWAGTHEARSQLPNLVRRLLADTPGVTELSMRAGRGVDYSGWDGRVDGGPGTAYVPAGLSCWEMSTSQDPKAQAQENYRKRTDNPQGADPATTTFVFVTLRRWSGKHRWKQSRHAEGIWHDVRVLDTDDLAGWLESRYGVHVWFSELLGLRPGDVERLDRWWSRWSAATDPRLTEDLLLARRSEEAEKLRSRLGGNPSGTGVKAGSSDEAIAFIAAVLHSLDDPDHLARSFVVDSARAWDHSVSTSGRSVLIPTFEGADVGAAVSGGHHVVVPMGVDDPGQAIGLPRLGRSEARAAFEAIGIEPDKADRFAVRARRSLTSLRRALSVNPRFARPAWAQGSDGDILAVLVLVGAWSGNREADQKLVAEIANRDYESVERLLRRWENTGDPPFRKSGTSWRLSNPEDAWLLLRGQIIHQDLERWSNSVLQVLGTRDPVLDLDTDARFVAPLVGIEQMWSSDLRRGLAQGIALLAVSETSESVGGRNGPGLADSLVEELLHRAGNDLTGNLWQQLTDVLPPLAEAAPRVFMEAVRRDAGGDSPLLGKMFTDTDVFSTSSHVGLLWALERLCWSSEHLPAAMDALLRLAKIDPGGQYMSRPLESARLTLWPLAPQTSASLDRRMDTLDDLLERFPNTGKNLLLELVPTKGSHSTESDKPRFRDWGSVEQPTGAEALRAVEAVQSRVARMETHTEPDPDAVLLRLEELVRSNADLFGWSLVEDAERDEIVERRWKAVQQLFELDGMGAVRQFARRVARPDLVGEVVADCFGDKLTEDLLQLLPQEGADRQLTLGWVARMAELQGTVWVGHVLADTAGLGDENRADILLTLPADREIWDLLAGEHEAVRESYWRRIGQPKVAAGSVDAYVDKLLEHDRVRHAVQVSWIRSNEEPAELIKNGTIELVLAAVSQMDSHRLRDLDVYYIGQLMDLLGPDFETVVSLEGRLFLMLDAAGRIPTGLYGRLREEPPFFVDLVCQVGGRAKEGAQSDASRVPLSQSSAWTILQGWRIPPGYDRASGDFDPDILRDWVLEVRRELAKRGLSDMGDGLIGQLLSGSPTGQDGVWPAEPVRDLIEYIESRHMEDGLVSGAMNNRGRTTHGILEGGEQERGLAGLYQEMAGKIDTRWLRAANVLRRLADNYEEEALRREGIVERRADLDFV
ncbi:MAG: hypothetical protein OXD34_01405 [bacterium]|nr:hypothetical protein [bacterium]